MANNYYDMTGVLLLDKATPVIKALFKPYNLDESDPGRPGQAYIAYIAEDSDTRWDCVLENLQDLIEQLGLSLNKFDGSPADTMEDVLAILAGHFEADGNAGLLNLLEHTEFDENAGLAELFEIAKAFDDGHGLKGYKKESAWHCSKPRLFEFGGAGEFVGEHFRHVESSTDIVDFAERIDGLLATGDCTQAATQMRQHVGSLLAGIHDEAARCAVQSALATLLSADGQGK